MLLRLRKANGWLKHTQTYEMNFGSEKWYNIHRDHMRLEGSSRLIRNLFNALLAGLEAEVEGAYNRMTQQLRLAL